MTNLAIKAENISKQYRLGEVGTGTLSHDLNRLWHKIRGKQDPYLRVGESNDRTKKSTTDYVWSLRDLNFEIEQGDAVGIIGRNGAGKSTLLKLLSKVTKPTTGNFKINGRIASLLEVGTGFNPEMTGRENVYMNGAMLGMRRDEIKRKFDEIVDFSGVEKYIDTPVKRYSSGMYVRLAFAVAAHLESEILIVDEVLAVGDAEFQKKCLGKMGSVSEGEGRTVLFVSHNMSAITALCNKGLYLNKGEIASKGIIGDVLKDYHNSINENDVISYYNVGDLAVGGFKFTNLSNLGFSVIQTGDLLSLKFKIKNNYSKKCNIEFNIEFFDSSEIDIFCVGNEFNNKVLEIEPSSETEIRIQFKINLIPDKYYMKVWINNFTTFETNYTDLFFGFEVEYGDIFGTGKQPKKENSHGFVIPEYEVNYLSM